MILVYCRNFSGILKVGFISAIVMREAITASKVPAFEQSEQSTFRIPLGIPVSMPPPEEGSDANASGSGAKSTTGDDKGGGKLSDSDDDAQQDLMGDESLFGKMTPEQKQAQMEGEITKYGPSSVVLSFNLNEVWIKKSKYSDISSDTYDNA